MKPPDPTLYRTDSEGESLSEEAMGRLTEPFNRGDRTRLAGGGLGLGLTIVDTIARTTGGTLALRPRKAGGLVADLVFLRGARQQTVGVGAKAAERLSDDIAFR